MVHYKIGGVYPLPKKKRKKKIKIQMTKIIVVIVLIISLMDLQIIILAPYFDKASQEVLGSAILTEIVGVVTAYCIKSFSETKEQKKNELLEKELNLKYKIEDNTTNEDDITNGGDMAN